MQQTYKQKQRVRRAAEEAEPSYPTASLSSTDAVEDFLATLDEVLDEPR